MAWSSDLVTCGKYGWTSSGDSVWKQMLNVSFQMFNVVFPIAVVRSSPVSPRTLEMQVLQLESEALRLLPLPTQVCPLTAFQVIPEDWPSNST